ncbi:hypothetical protein [Flavobacterium sp. UMI-01]|uniref:hypothetical protein n=1 Tax=Flavobacterium sp. UMI-01 TaxID=1441053 RepID=UPI001C7D8EE4|nr:hypothetical protein [Flavobacterium sp. UMI-01]GIZ08361.1 hypothetical protein FUMI01_10880 [Flavobacterium sp. UMI-01]
MITTNQIQNTETFKNLVTSSPFLEKILLKRATVESVQRIVYQIKKFGEEYIEDKNYLDREVKIAKEIIENLNS